MEAYLPVSPQTQRIANTGRSLQDHVGPVFKAGETVDDFVVAAVRHPVPQRQAAAYLVGKAVTAKAAWRADGLSLDAERYAGPGPPPSKCFSPRHNAAGPDFMDMNLGGGILWSLWSKLGPVYEPTGLATASWQV
eukprot:gene60134-80197_t